MLILFERSPSPSWAYDPVDLSIQMVNDAAIAQYGYSRDEFLSMTIEDLRPLQDIPRLRDTLRTRLRQPTRGQEWRHKKKDGTLFYVEVSTEPIVYQGQDLTLVVVNDITEKTKSTGWLQLAAMAGRMVFLEVNYVDDRITVIDKGGFLGAETASMTVDEYLALIHPDDRDMLRAAYYDGKQGRVADLQFRIVHPQKGSVIWVERRTRLIFDSFGTCTEGRGILIDITAQKQIEEKLTDSCRLLEQAANQQSSLLKSLPGHVAMISNEGIILTVNDAWSRFAKYNGLNMRNFGIGQSYFQPLPGQDAPDVFDQIKKVLSGEMKEFEHEYPCHSNDTKRWFRMHVTSFPVDDKCGAIIMHLDLTERMLLNEQLKVSQANMFSILDNTDDAYLLVDSRYRIKEFNRRCIDNVRSFGQQYVKGESLLNRLSHTRRDAILEHFREAATGNTVQYDISYGEGEAMRWFRMTMNAVFSPDEISGYVICGRDITNEKTTEHALRESEERFRALIENSTDMVVVLSERQRLVYASPNASSVLNVNGQDILGMQFDTFVHPDDLGSYQKLMQKVIEVSEKPFHLIIRVSLPDFGWSWIEARMTNFLHLSAIRGIVCNFRDIGDRLEVENELKRSQFILQKANEVAKIGYWTCGVSLDSTLEWSPQMFRIFGIAEKGFPGKVSYFFNLVHPDDRAAVERAFHKSVRDIEGFNSEYRVVLPNGATKWQHARAEVFCNEQGEPHTMIGVVRDITERKLHIESIRTSRNNLNALINNTTDLIWSVDTGYRLLSANDAFREGALQWHGAMLREGDNVLAMDHRSQEYFRWKDFYDRALKGEEVRFEEVVATNKDEKYFFDVALNPVFDHDAIVGVSCYMRDVTARRKSESEALASSERFKLLSMATNDAVWDWDILSGRLNWNHGVMSIFGYESREELNQIDWWAARVHPDDLERISSSIAAAFKSNTIQWHESYRFERVDGTFRHIHDRGYIIYQDSKPIRMIGAMQDVHEVIEYRMSLEQKVEERTRELNEALQRQKEVSEMRSRFVSIASHEFRTPLSTISFAADFLRRYRSKANPEDIDKKLDTISQQISHMVALLDDVLVVGKATSGKLKVCLGRVPLRNFFRQVGENAKIVSGSNHDLQMIFDIDDDDFTTDEKLLVNIFSNLIGNAIKYSPDQDHILVRVSREDNYLVAFVCDNGIGIEANDQCHVYEPFTRGANVGNISGSGLGLTIVSTAVELLSGELTFCSGSGYRTVFRVRLPGFIER